VEEQFIRTAMQLGHDNMEKLFAAKVAVFGIGGVGGHCAEALCRTGIGHIDLFDNDTVSLSNLNRQIVALHSTLGQYKVDVMKQRLLDINPKAAIGAHRLFYLPETAHEVDLSAYDYVVDAIDTVTAKLELVRQAQFCQTPIISSMGAANRLDPTALRVTDIYKTSACPLARIMRRELRKAGISSLKVVCSEEPAGTPVQEKADGDNSRPTPASNAFVPAAAGLILAGEVIKDIISLGMTP